jgi:hypothetical protein
MASKPAAALLFLLSITGFADPAVDFGFEDVSEAGGLRAWKASSAYPFDMAEPVKEDPRLVRTGKYSLKLVQQNADKPGHFNSEPTLPLQPNTTYTFSFWAKGAGHVAGLLYLNAIKDGNEAFHSSYYPERAEGSPEKLTDEWQQFKFTLDTGKLDAKVKSARLVILASGTVYVDDCAFEKGAPSKPAAAVKPAPPPAEVVVVRPNLVSLNSVPTPPRVDGVIAENEYPLSSAGLVDCKSRALHATPSSFFLPVTRLDSISHCG